MAQGSILMELRGGGARCHKTQTKQYTTKEKKTSNSWNELVVG
jgi:hypothetical protein